MEDCVFCRIMQGSVPSSIVYADEKTVALLDIQPVNPGHVLVVPKIHVALLSELDEETGAHLFTIAMQVAKALRLSGVKCEGVNLLLADGEAAGQEIAHVHLHVIPRFRGDGFEMRFGSNYGLRPERKELDKIASKIKEAMR